MGLFDRFNEPVFLKTSTQSEDQLKELQACYEQAQSKELKQDIQEAIYAVQAGIAGEKQIEYELKNSHMGMYVLHDVCLALKDYKCQIDYLVITRFCVFVIECKNLYGEITIDHNGQFVRKVSYGKYYKKESMYSPFEQNRKHLELMKQIGLNGKNFLQQKLFENSFPHSFKSLVVLANSKSVLNDRYAPKELRNAVVRAENLVSTMKKINSQENLASSSANEMKEIAERWLSRCVTNETDYTAKFKERIAQEAVPVEPEKTVPQNTNSEPVCPVCGGTMVKRISRKGAHAGESFYGCSNYPRCRGLISQAVYESMMKGNENV